MRRLAIFSCSFVAACAAYVWVLSRVSFLVCIGLFIAMAIIACFFSGDNAKRMRIASGAAAIGLLWSYGYEMIKIEPMRELCAQNILIEATVSGYPETTKYGCRVETNICGGTMLVYLDDKHDDLKPSDRIRMYAEVVDASKSGGEEENLYFQSRDISLLAFENEEPTIFASESIALRYLPTHWAHVLRQRIDTLFPDDTEGFVRALLTGEKDGIVYAVRDEMSRTGLSHVFSVSGMHVSLLIGFFMLLIKNKRLAAICGIVAMAVFAAMLGFTPSVTRAAIMNTVLLLAPILGRENDPATSLSFSLLILLLDNPWAIANLSLQLSYLSMVGIFLFASKIHNHITPRYFAQKRTLFASVFRALSVNFSTSLSATVATLPVTAATFGTISLISPLANLLLLNLISMIFSVGFAVLICGIATPIGLGLAWLLSWPIRLVMLVMRFLAGLPFAAVYTDVIYFALWLICAYLMLALFFLSKKDRRLRYIGSATLATLFCAIAFSIIDVPTDSITMLDVGQGQSIFMHSGEFTAMVDCGGDQGDADGETAARALLKAGYSELDALILTHFDADHICGAEQLMRRIRVRHLLIPDIYDDQGRRAQVLEAAQKAQVEVIFVTQDMTLEGENAKIQLFAPVSDKSDNEGLCALMSLEECDILITGDMSIEGEHALLKTHELPQVEILVAGHHGSKYSTSPALLRRVRPQTVLISVGDNSYGHPSKEVLERIAHSGAQVLTTSICGNITIKR